MVAAFNDPPPWRVHKRAQRTDGALMSLRDWLRRNGYYGRDPATHTFFDGGKACVPPSARDAFHKAYLACVGRGEELHVIERTPSPKFSFFMDVDVPTGVELAWPGVAQAVCAVLPGTDSGPVIVCGKREARGAKCGMHIFWPGITVNADIAVHVCKEVAARLPAEGRWIDSSVYRTGLRMLWSRKGPASAATDFYEPLHDGVAPSLEWLHTCSLWPKADARDLTQEYEVVDVPRAPSHTDTFGIEDLLPLEYGACRLRNVSRSERSVVLSSTSKYCANVGREHRSNHVYFVATSDGVFQRCHCACDDLRGRREGLCKNFSVRVADPPTRLFGLRPSKSALDLARKQREAFFKARREARSSVT
jgi:hypothetical protein